MNLAVIREKVLHAQVLLRFRLSGIQHRGPGSEAQCMAKTLRGLSKHATRIRNSADGANPWRTC
jgi:hypothetical protein